MDGPAHQLLADGRLHLQHGPIDLVLRGFGAESAVAEAHRTAVARFATVLGELVGELPELRKPMSGRPRVEGRIARRMVAACRPHKEFVTPMAAVAGAVADEILAAMCEAAPLDKAFVNDGGDIALHLTEGETLAIGVAADFSRGPVPAVNGRVTLRHQDGIGGIATSGRQGRSFSLGLADSVTVLARDAATADAAATLIANAVDLPGHPGVERAPATDLDPDSDLGPRLVTVAVPALSPDEIAAALEAGRSRAAAMRAAGLIRSAALMLQGRSIVLHDSREIRP
ncbi:thiamine biosynthesis protein ApbE [Methylobacterium indicum]|uniref:UPF0280 family protein n=1 Tax=Methylobacterium indicum TaxID=1775910 RepID=UPI000734601B|nr:UPF0280 family protein [Methylobacterium indicum]KTS33759.1 thiamine biosynthesis protein ApbE [Methylobacterium indicum]KTS40327.1 thiamine biosynthesis protein ApbE [Methylobacterium indicum]KTS50418.1 thiamine biosynthesis protein ApbE [Methylobacterium indicum]